MSNPSFSQSKSKLINALSAGDLLQAGELAEQFMLRFPDKPEAHYFSGLHSLLAQENEKAVQQLEVALGFDDKNLNVLLNLGVAYQRLGKMDAATQAYLVVLAMEPVHIQALINLGSCHYQKKSFLECKEAFSKAASLAPDNSTVISGLADAERSLGNWRKAIQLYKRAITINPDDERANNNLTLMHLNLQHHGQVKEAARKAIEKNPDNIDAYIALGRAHIAEEGYEEGMDTFASAFEKKPEHPELLTAIGNNYLNIGDHSEASSWFNKALSLDSSLPGAILGMAQCLDKHDLHGQGIALLNENAESLSSLPQYWVTLSDLYWNEGEADEALRCLEKASALAPQQASLYCKMGGILSSSGNMEGADACFRQALAEQEDCIGAISGLATLKKSSLEASHVQKAHELLEKDALPDGAKGSLHSALSYYYSGNKDFSSAVAHMAEANRFQWASRVRQGWEYQQDSHQQVVATNKQLFTRQLIETGQQIGHSSDMPVFIVGMPRSGTTLTEQIMARHPSVLGVGERNYAVIALQAYQHLYAEKFSLGHAEAKKRSLTEPDSDLLHRVAEEYLTSLREQIEKANKPGVRYVVDKMPDNYMNVGWIKLLFPNASIIHARRDMRDVAISCWQTQFGMIRWACHIKHLVARFEGYLEMMAHWQNVCPDGFMNADYEVLIDDQESGSRKLLEHIGLPWDDACLKFYESDRLVRTASITQVRQPIYKTSVAKWAPYEELIPELIHPLSALMKVYR